MLILEFFDEDYEDIMEFYRRNILVDDKVFFAGKDCILPSELAGSIFSEERIIYYDFEDRFIHSTLLDNGLVQSSNYLLFFSWFNVEKLNLSDDEIYFLKNILINEEYRGYKNNDFLKINFDDSDGTLLFVWMYPGNQFMITEDELDGIILQTYFDFHFRILDQLSQVVLNFVKHQVSNSNIEFIRLEKADWDNVDKVFLKDIHNCHELTNYDKIRYKNHLNLEIDSFFTSRFRV